MVLDLWVPQNQSFNTSNFNVQRAITQKKSGGDNPKYGGAQQLMLGNLPLKFKDSMLYGSQLMPASKSVIY